MYIMPGRMLGYVNVSLRKIAGDRWGILVYTLLRFVYKTRRKYVDYSFIGPISSAELRPVKYRAVGGARVSSRLGGRRFFFCQVCDVPGVPSRVARHVYGPD